MADPVTSVPRQLLGLLGELAEHVLLEPLRAGLAGWRNLPPGYSTLVALTGLLIMAALGFQLAVMLFPQWLPVVAAAGGPAVSGGPEFFLFGITVVVALAQTAGLRAPWPLALTLWLGSGVILLRFTSLDLSQWPAPITWLSPAVWILLGVFALLRRQRTPAWWEFAVVWATVLLTAYLPILVAKAGAPQTDSGPTAAYVDLLGTLLGNAAAPLALLTGGALSAIASALCLWLVELLTRRTAVGGELLGRGPLLVITLLLALAILGGCAWLLRAAAIGPLDLAQTIAMSLALLLAVAMVWAVLDARVNRVRPGSTELPELTSRMSDIAWPAAIFLAVPFVVLTVPMTIYLMWRTNWATVPLSAAIGGAIAAMLQWSGARMVAEAGGAVCCVALAWLAARRGQRSRAQLLGVIGISLAASLIAWQLGLRQSPAAVGALLVLAALAVLVRAALRQRLSGAVLEATATTVLLAGALVNLELVADPIGTILQSAGGLVAILALVWTVLTFGDLATGHSPRFPRTSRVLLMLAALLVAILLSLRNQLLPSSHAMTIDGLVSSGANQLGVPLMVCVAIAVLAGALRGEEPLGPTTARRAMSADIAKSRKTRPADSPPPPRRAR